uniref:MYM-type domain-containing protein n=1 Tax=viral metagenome TaxID=1070528 RepID=A0A6C0KB63_9ZZZZ
MDLFRQSDHVLDMSMSMLDGSTEDYMSYELVKLSDRGRSSPWPTTTQTACWHCCHQFANAPVGVPVDTTGSNHRLMGNFCSFNCAYAWALGQANHHTDYTAGCRVKQFAAEVFEVDPVSIVAAPDPLVLEMFGGPMSIEQFRGNVDNVRVIQEPFVSSHMLLCTVRTHETQKGEKKPAPEKDSGRGRFSVTGLRRPKDPLPLEKVLCEQDMSIEKGLFQEVLDQRAAEEPACGATTVVSTGLVTEKPRAKKQNSLHKLLKKT